MWPHLDKEMDAFKQSCYSDWYREFRRKLPSATDCEKRRKHELLEIENSFLYLISYVITRYEDGGWGKDTGYPQLLTSHMLRLLTDMNVSLKDHWNPARDVTNRPSEAKGNLYKSTTLLLSKFEENPPEEKHHFAMWGTDFWDDCYILLSLLKVKDELRSIDRVQADDLDTKFNKSLAWLQQQVKTKFRTVKKHSSWFGLGFHAAAIELFDYLQLKGRITEGNRLIGEIAKDVARRIGDDAGERFAWQAGQLIVAWNEKRDRYPGLRKIDEQMEQLYDALKERQDKSGAWISDDVLNTNYNTVRGLAACYVKEKDKPNGLLESDQIRLAHDYLLRQMHQAEPLGVVVKACVNAIEAFQKLFGFTIPNIHFHLLVSLSYRLHCLGLEKTILSPPAENQPTLLRTIRRVVRERLEHQSETAIEPLGVNGRLYADLSRRPQFLDQFNEEHETTRRELQAFLSSTMTEVRSTLAKRLIKELWKTGGFLNFLPLIEHLSDLESERAFYAFYRDHLNHEVLLFLLGAYIYYQNDIFREAINEEIRETYKHFTAKPPDNLEKEFLFRWKLVATFHDVGYLFEIDPDPQRYESKKEQRQEKDRLLTQSFGMIEKVRSGFLVEYFLQFEKPGKKSIRADIRVIERQLKKYLPPLTRDRVEDLFVLKTAGNGKDAFSMMDEMLNLRGAGHIAPGIIKNYFNLCRAQRSDNRDKFYDHGVMSALILLKVADIHRFYLRQLSEAKFSKKLKDYRTFQGLLMQQSTDEAQERFHIRFSHVAGAIALHNIYPHLYSKAQCCAFDRSRRVKADKVLERAFYSASATSKTRYSISLNENAMAYLTALADVLQDWDRHSFRKTPYELDEKTPIASSEVMIDCNARQIIVTPLSPAAKRNYVDHLNGIKSYMTKSRSHVKLTGTR